MWGVVRGEGGEERRSRSERERSEKGRRGEGNLFAGKKGEKKMSRCMSTDLR